MNTIAKNVVLVVASNGLGLCYEEIDLTRLVSRKKCKGKTTR
jgi:hypothetical protein